MFSKNRTRPEIIFENVAFGCGSTVMAAGNLTSYVAVKGLTTRRFG